MATPTGEGNGPDRAAAVLARANLELAAEHADADRGDAWEHPADQHAAMVERIADALRLLVEPRSVTELRALGVSTRGYRRPHAEGGFFDADHLDLMAGEAARLTMSATGVYLTLNPLDPALLARRCNRVDIADTGELATDHDVILRRWLLIDIDPVRPAKISSTAAEKRAALEVISTVRDYLAGQSWPAPIVVDSGNGYHALYRIDMPRDDGDRVQRVLKNLASRFGTEAVHIDTSVHNPSRICKIPGTWARKGDSTTDRPHRPSFIMEGPGRAC